MTTTERICVSMTSGQMRRREECIMKSVCVLHSETTSQPHQRRRVSMFSSVPPTIEADPKPRRRRVTTDSSIRMEMLRQQVAEDRRQKLRSAVEKLKKTDHRARTPSPDFDGSSPFVGERRFSALLNQRPKSHLATTKTLTRPTSRVSALPFSGFRN